MWVCKRIALADNLTNETRRGRTFSISEAFLVHLRSTDPMKDRCWFEGDNEPRPRLASRCSYKQAANKDSRNMWPNHSRSQVDLDAARSFQLS